MVETLTLLHLLLRRQVDQPVITIRHPRPSTVVHGSVPSEPLLTTAIPRTITATVVDGEARSSAANPLPRSRPLRLYLRHPQSLHVKPGRDPPQLPAPRLLQA